MTDLSPLRGPWLLDSNVLLRLAEDGSPLKAVAEAAVLRLRDEGASLYVTGQNLIEYLAVATRPIERNGLGKTVEAAWRDIERFKRLFYFVDETPAVYGEWEALARRFKVAGLQVHDTRLVAVMRANDFTRLLTFDREDFRRFIVLMMEFTDPRDLVPKEPLTHDRP